MIIMIIMMIIIMIIKMARHWIINLIDDSSEDIDVVMILSRRKVTRAVIVACIEHYCSTHTDVLSYCYH